MYEGISVTPFKEEFDAANLKRCWKECLAKSEYYSRKTSVEEFNKQNYWKKKGIAIIPMKFSVGYNTTYYHQVNSRNVAIKVPDLHHSQIRDPSRA